MNSEVLPCSFFGRSISPPAAVRHSPANCGIIEDTMHIGTPEEAIAQLIEFGIRPKAAELTSEFIMETLKYGMNPAATYQAMLDRTSDPLKREVPESLIADEAAK